MLITNIRLVLHKKSDLNEKTAYSDKECFFDLCPKTTTFDSKSQFRIVTILHICVEMIVLSIPDRLMA